MWEYSNVQSFYKKDKNRSSYMKYSNVSYILLNDVEVFTCNYP